MFFFVLFPFLCNKEYLKMLNVECNQYCDNCAYNIVSNLSDLCRFYFYFSFSFNVVLTSVSDPFYFDTDLDSKIRFLDKLIRIQIRPKNRKKH